VIIDKEECKALVDHTDADNDDLIERLIPLVQDDLVDYCNNTFPDPIINYWCAEVSFVSGTSDTITDGQSEFVKKRFAAGMDIFVKHNSSNQGIYELSTVAAGTLTLTSGSSGTGSELVSMAYNDTNYPCGDALIYKIVWPKPLKLVAARMVWYLVEHAKPAGELNENVDGVIKAYDRTRSYPREIMEMADKYRRLSFV